MPVKRSRSRSSAGRTLVSMARRRLTKRYRRKARGARVTGTHVFSRRLAANTLEINGLYLANQWVFKFGDILEHTEFSSLFEKYRIDSVVMKFQLINNPNTAYPLNTASSSSVAASTNWFPKMWYAIDDDGGVTDTISTMKERQGVRCRILEPNKTVTVVIRPKIRVLAYNTATTTGTVPKRATIDMADHLVPHFGLSTVIDTNGIDPQDTYPFKVNVEMQYKFSCMGVR